MSATDTSTETPADIHPPVDRTSLNACWVSLACELQRDWAREETVAGVVEIVLTERLLKE